MLIIIILAIIILSSLFALGYIIFKHLPDLKNLDVDLLKHEAQDKTKARIIQAKFQRSAAKLQNKLLVFFAPQKDFLFSRFRQIKKQLTELEAKYAAKDQAATADLSSAIDVFTQINNLIGKEEFAAAEKKLIELIVQNNKNIKAYEILGGLYLINKNYEQAEEVFKHLLKLAATAGGVYQSGRFEEVETEFLSSLNVDSRAAGYYNSLGQIYELTEKTAKALDCYLKAASVEPNNPKYLDKLVELSIKLGDRGLAKRTFNRLKKINPDNAKLADLKAAIEKIK